MYKEEVYVLFLITVDSQRRPAILPQIFGDIICNTLCADENKNFGVLAAYLVKMLDEFAAFLEVGADFNVLLDVVIGGQLHRTDINLHKVGKEVRRKFLHVLWPCGAKH